MAAERERTGGSGKDERRRAAIRGGDSVRAAFATAITRRRFAELVGISLTTVRRWEAAGVVKPRREVILNIPAWVFDRSDVVFGRRLIALLRERHGELSLKEAAKAVRRGRRR